MTIYLYIARLVAKGFRELPDIDYTETFIPVAKLTTIQNVLSLVSKLALTSVRCQKCLFTLVSLGRCYMA